MTALRILEAPSATYGAETARRNPSTATIWRVSRRGFNEAKELIKMVDIVIGAAITLIAAIIAVFLILLAVNVALVRKLRSIIPPSPDAGRAAERLPAHRGEKATTRYSGQTKSLERHAR